MTKNDRYLILVYWLTIFFMLTAFTPQSHGQSNSLPDSDTWCMGRYLIDLPKATKVEVEYMTKGSTDRNALKLWDTILSSLRLRSGT